LKYDIIAEMTIESVKAKLGGDAISLVNEIKVTNLEGNGLVIIRTAKGNEFQTDNIEAIKGYVNINGIRILPENIIDILLA
jgi:hypothetical protein